MPVDLDEVIHKHLTARNLQYTEGRRHLIKAFAAAAGPQSAEELHRRLKRKVSLPSLYRSLSVMHEAGILSTHYTQERLARFELAEWLTGHHHHLVCTNCNKIYELELSPQEEDSLSRLVKASARKKGFEVTDHILEISGVCAGCRKA